METFSAFHVASVSYGTQLDRAEEFSRRRLPACVILSARARRKLASLLQPVHQPGDESLAVTKNGYAGSWSANDAVRRERCSSSIFW
jgi:hypothetical protein